MMNFSEKHRIPHRAEGRHHLLAYFSTLGSGEGFGIWVSTDTVLSLTLNPHNYSRRNFTQQLITGDHLALNVLGPFIHLSSFDQQQRQKIVLQLGVRVLGREDNSESLIIEAA